MNTFNFEGEGGKIEEISKSVEKDETKEKEFEIPHSLKGHFNKNEDGTIDIKTENGVLEKVSKDILPKDLQKEEKGEFFITFADHSEIAKEVLNKLLKVDQNG